MTMHTEGPWSAAAMTPIETANFLRQFNEWRRGDEDIPQPDPRVIGEAIDAADEMIDRLEAAEKELDALRSKNNQYEMRLRKILEEPENTISNSKALAEAIRQARLALGVKK